MKRSTIAPLVLVLAVAVSASAASAETLQGVVRYTGPEIEPRMLRMDADPKCAELHEGSRVPDRNILVGENGALANAFVWLKTPPAGAGPFATPEEPKQLVQHGCFYEPRVMGIMVEQTLEVVNDDPTLHNVRSLARTNRPINLGQPVGSPPRTKFFTKPEEAVKFKCDVHPWMASYVFVLDHPFYATTGADGTFSIPDLPAGAYTLSVWHETLGAKDVQVEVPAAGAPVEVVYDAPPAD